MNLHPALEGNPYYDALSEDPTSTKTLREEYARNLRGRFADINTAIRRAVGENDIFGLQNDALVSPPEAFDFDDEREAVERFEAWLDQAQEDEVLDVISRDDNIYVRRAYEKGLVDADRNLSQAGMDIDAIDREAARQAMQMPVHEDKLQVVFSRNFAELDGITDVVSQQVAREIAEGISEGVNPNEMARRMADRVDKIGKTRATTLARTETIRAHSSATLERYKQQGVDEVGLEPEVSVQTATDQLVCEECAEVAQSGPWPIEDFEGSENQPPIHPNCRCSVIPVVSEEALAAYKAYPSQFAALYREGAFANRPDRYEVLATVEPEQADALVEVGGVSGAWEAVAG